MDLTGLLGDCGGLALAILRHSDHTNVIVDTRFQSVNSIMTSRWQNHVFKDGYTLAGCHYRDPVTSDGCGVERWPAEADAGVAHVLEGEVRQLRDFCVGGGRIGGRGCRGEERKREDNRSTKQTRGKGRMKGKGLDTRARQRKPTDKKTGAVVKASNENCPLPVGWDIQHITPMEELMQGCFSWYILLSSEVSTVIQWSVPIENSYIYTGNTALVCKQSWYCFTSAAGSKLEQWC